MGSLDCTEMNTEVTTQVEGKSFSCKETSFLVSEVWATAWDAS